MKICKTCVLPETFPGIALDEEGRCLYCRRYTGREDGKKQKERFKQKFLSLLEQVRNKGSYDALVAYSGGKDSTYLLRLLKETFGLKVLAITFDHGFVSPMALQNIRTVTDNLDIDHLSLRPGAPTIGAIFVKSMVPGIYPLKALERASSICNSCMNLVKSFLLKTAVEMRVPLIAYGWSPGQAPIQSSVFKTNPSIVRQMQKAMMAPMKKMNGDTLSGFFLRDDQLEPAPASEPDPFPYLVHPLAFLDYNEQSILKEVQELGWVKPKDTDENSTNCLLNSFAIEVHLQQYGFHPYAFEIAGLVREGYMTREEGLKKLSAPSEPKIIEYVKQRLGLKND
jgi:tRNA(Ile)-lysidine synthase TilS/MesJ